MRSSILLWSAFSGFVLALFVGIAALAVILIGSELLTPLVPRLSGRPRAVVLIVALLVLPAAGAAVGLLEGRLKLR